MKYSYIIVDDSPDQVAAIKALADGFSNLVFLGAADNYDDGLDLILDKRPDLIFLETSPANPQSGLSYHLMDAAYRFLKDEPRFVMVSTHGTTALNALRRNAFDFLIKPVAPRDLRQVVLKLEKVVQPSAAIALPILAMPADAPVAEAPKPEPVEERTELGEEETRPEISVEEVDKQIVENETGLEVPEPQHPLKEKPLIICVKSYGDYRFISADDICYLQADNNSTDLHLANGEMITAFKTLKHFENVLKSPFVRIHNSYIVNIDYVSRIHTGNSVCYIKNTTTKLPFSKSYKENIDSILQSITKGNYLEI